MNVTLRQRTRKTKITLYLDIYYSEGKRENEPLNLYLIPEPAKGRLNPIEKEHNRKVTELAESIRAKRFLEIQNGLYGFRDKQKMKASFIAYMELLAKTRKDSDGNFGNWQSAINHLKKYVAGDVTFEQIDKRWIEGWKDYLVNQAVKKNGEPLSPNSQLSYYSKTVAALKEAVKDEIIIKNPAELVKGLEGEETEIEFLTLEEVEAAAKEDCEIPVLKAAFIFSCYTGLRWSDIEKLVWDEIEHSKENGYYIRFRQKKTSGLETLPLPDDAYTLLGTRKEKDALVFEGLKYSAWTNLKLAQWLMKAGITKDITFHCARHTFATLLLTLGVDIYTVSKLLGHKNLKTTQRYAKVIDEKKRDAVNRIKLSINLAMLKVNNE